MYGAHGARQSLLELPLASSEDGDAAFSSPAAPKVRPGHCGEIVYANDPPELLRGILCGRFGILARGSCLRARGCSLSRGRKSSPCIFDCERKALAAEVCIAEAADCERRASDGASRYKNKTEHAHCCHLGVTFARLVYEDNTRPLHGQGAARGLHYLVVVLANLDAHGSAADLWCMLLHCQIARLLRRVCLEGPRGCCHAKVAARCGRASWR